MWGDPALRGPGNTGLELGSWGWNKRCFGDSGRAQALAEDQPQDCLGREQGPSVMGLISREWTLLESVPRPSLAALEASVMALGAVQEPSPGSAHNGTT